MRFLSITSILIAVGCATPQHLPLNTVQPNAASVPTLADAVAVASASPAAETSVETAGHDRPSDEIVRDLAAKPGKFLGEIVGTPPSVQPPNTPPSP